MSIIAAIIAALIAFAVPLAIPLFVQRWRTFLIVLAVAAAFFTWLTLDLQGNASGDPPGLAHLFGPLLGGLMLVGFWGGAIAKFVMLVGRRPTSEIDSSSD
ncbi:MAG TPA: hypothetical protein VGN80_00850 [Devosiaceae bacterium]|jgi:peptidoglycan/LPS O-acetylase OafA/YrhL|nr:hypothetical protein [Devosiaceae bacterium]